MAGRRPPTYVNGKEWRPQWHKKANFGPDKCAPYRIELGQGPLQVELLAVTKFHGETGVQKRTPITGKMEGAHFVVRIPDPEPGARWYKLVVRRKK